MYGIYERLFSRGPYFANCTHRSFSSWKLTNPRNHTHSNVYTLIATPTNFVGTNHPSTKFAKSRPLENINKPIYALYVAVETRQPKLAHAHKCAPCNVLNDGWVIIFQKSCSFPSSYKCLSECGKVVIRSITDKNIKYFLRGQVGRVADL